MFHYGRFASQLRVAAITLWPVITENSDVITRNYEISIVNARNCENSNVTTKNWVEKFEVNFVLR